jgi:hypothetical protein
MELLGCELKRDHGCHQLASDRPSSCRPWALIEEADAVAVVLILRTVQQYGPITIFRRSLSHGRLLLRLKQGAQASPTFTSNRARAGIVEPV